MYAPHFSLRESCGGCSLNNINKCQHARLFENILYSVLICTTAHFPAALQTKALHYSSCRV